MRKWMDLFAKIGSLPPLNTGMQDVCSLRRLPSHEATHQLSHVNDGHGRMACAYLHTGKSDGAPHCDGRDSSTRIREHHDGGESGVLHTGPRTATPNTHPTKK